MSAPDYLETSRQFARQLEGREGVISVGLGKEKGEVVLVVAVDRLPPGSRRSRIDPEEAGLPKEFQGIRVIVEDLGRAELYGKREEATMNGDGKLSYDEQIEVLRLVATEWFDREGARAFAVVQGATREAKLEEITDIPEALAGVAVDMLLSSHDDDVKGWTRSSIEKVKRARLEADAQVLDPVTAAIVGGAVIGAILAARVRTVGSMTFYKGVPEELAKVLKAGESILSQAARLIPGAGED